MNPASAVENDVAEQIVSRGVVRRRRWLERALKPVGSTIASHAPPLRPNVLRAQTLRPHRGHGGCFDGYEVKWPPRCAWRYRISTYLFFYSTRGRLGVAVAWHTWWLMIFTPGQPCRAPREYAFPSLCFARPFFLSFLSTYVEYIFLLSFLSFSLSFFPWSHTRI